MTIQTIGSERHASGEEKLGVGSVSNSCVHGCTLGCLAPSVCLGLTVEIREDDLFSPEPHFMALCYRSCIDKPALDNDQ